MRRAVKVPYPVLQRIAWAVIAVVAVAGALVYRHSQTVIHAIDGYTMGSTWSVRFSGPPSADVAAVQAQLEAELAALDFALSGYRNDSALARLNAAPVGEWIDIPDHLWNVLYFGLELWRESGGAFDLTVKPLVDLWGFGAAQPRVSVPTEAEIAAARSRVDSGQLELAADGHRARRLADISIDVDGVAPGYAAGVLSGWLTAHGFGNHLVEIGGEMHASGLRPDGERWRVGIETPELARGHVDRVVAVTDAAVTTAGDYRDYFEVDGARYTHILDPLTGRPVAHNIASVTVLAPGKLTADGYATAIMVMGEERGLAFADARDLPVLMVLRANDGAFHERYNKSFAAYMVQHPGGRTDSRR
jgi:FAD:protein FMN transferase